MIIKLYRHTIKHIEYTKDSEIITYYQTQWGSVATFIPSKNQEVVKIETKEININ